MERESFEDERTARADERELRLREGRPRGAPRRRRDLHGGRAGDDRARRLAAERVPHPRAAAVLRRHLLPARAAPRACPRGRRCCRRSPRPGASAREEIRAGGERLRERLCGGALLAPSAEPLDATRARRGGRGAASELRRAQRRLRRRAQVPAGVGARVLLAGCADGAEAQMALATLRAMAARRHPRPARRRLSPLQRRRRLDGAALREDALRQRAARARLPARLASSPASTRLLDGLRATRSTGRCARCAAPRAASTRRSTPTPRASRARFYVWTLARAARAPRRGRATPRSPGSGASEQGNFADPHHPAAGSERARATAAARADAPSSASGSASACSPRASSARARGSTTSA